MLPDRETVEEVLTEPTEVTRWGIGIASVIGAGLAFVLDRLLA